MKNVLDELNNIKQGQLKSVYILLGTEQYFINQFKHGMTQLLKDKVNDDVFTYDLLETPIQVVVNDAETLPFFNEHKLIFVDHPYFITAEKVNTSISHDIAALENYLSQSAPFSTLVFIAPYEKIDARKRISKQLKKHGQFISCQPVKQQDMRRWINQLAKENQIELSNDASDILEAEFDTNLNLLQNEIEKLSFYVTKGERVSRDDVLDIISSSLTNNAFQLVDAVLKRSLHDAILIYNNLKKLGEESIQLIGLLAFQFRIILQVKVLREKGLPLHAIQKEVKAHRYVVSLAFDRAAHFTRNQLAFIISQLVMTDEKIKRGEMDEVIAFELLLYNLTNQIETN